MDFSARWDSLLFSRDDSPYNLDPEVFTMEKTFTSADSSRFTALGGGLLPPAPCSGPAGITFTIGDSVISREIVNIPPLVKGDTIEFTFKVNIS